VSGPTLPRRVLVANRGEIALRIARTCRAAGVEVAAVHTEPDREAPHVLGASWARAVESYLDGPGLVEAAGALGCDAVHPGYGFLAENADFARAVRQAGLTWIGPPPEAMETMGSKTEARAAMEAAGVPVVPGCPAASPAELRAAAERIGFPVLVKAAAGGGGKGMTRVDDAEVMERVARQASEEARRSFGDGAVYLEKLVDRPRHVEIQVFADRHGHCVSLGERECSIQRRHQKIVEESPSPAVDPRLRRDLGDAAVAAAEAVGYEGAGTVEFLLAPDGAFYFLEMNTRLQVEHPVTEWVTGLDLVRLQLEVACGAELPPEALKPSLNGWAIECRLYAEDPAAGHLPQAGPVLVLREPSGPGLRIDSALREGVDVTVHYDPLLAKVSTWGRTRHEAAERMHEALSRYVILGLRTNVSHLQDVVAHPAFLAGDLSTAFLDEHLADWRPPEPGPAALAATALPTRAGSGRSGSAAGPRVLDPWLSGSGFRLGQGSP
jgi:acetyl/propionyl-CoA carboxylase alpha subunit